MDIARTPVCWEQQPRKLQKSGTVGARRGGGVWGAANTSPVLGVITPGKIL